MFDIFIKFERRIGNFVNETIKTYIEVLSSAQNRLVIGLAMAGAGVGLIASAYLRAPNYK